MQDLARRTPPSAIQVIVFTGARGRVTAGILVFSDRLEGRYPDEFGAVWILTPDQVRGRLCVGMTELNVNYKMPPLIIIGGFAPALLLRIRR